MLQKEDKHGKYCISIHNFIGLYSGGSRERGPKGRKTFLENALAVLSQFVIQSTPDNSNLQGK